MVLGPDAMRLALCEVTFLSSFYALRFFRLPPPVHPHPLRRVLPDELLDDFSPGLGVLHDVPLLVPGPDQVQLFPDGKEVRVVRLPPDGQGLLVASSRLLVLVGEVGRPAQSVQGPGDAPAVPQRAAERQPLLDGLPGSRSVVATDRLHQLP